MRVGLEFGTDGHAPRLIKQQVQDAGFIKVEEHVLKLPVGPWPKDPRLKKCGLFEIFHLDEGMSGLTMMLFTRCLGWSREQVEVFLVSLRDTIKDKRVQSYH